MTGALQTPGLLAVLLVTLIACPSASCQEAALELRKDDRIAIVGNTFAERMGLFGFLETSLQIAWPRKQLRLRNLGWSADEVTLQPRPLNFGSQDDHLKLQKADVIIMCFGLNEAYAGTEGLKSFEKAYDDLVSRTRQQKYNGKTVPRLVLISPIAHEFHGGSLPPREFVGAHNKNLELYTKAIRRIALKNEVAFVDLFKPCRDHYRKSGAAKLTRNGIHLTESGYKTVCGWLAGAFGLAEPKDPKRQEQVRALIRKKNEQFFFLYRAVNGEYIYGRRKAPFGIHSFPPEMKRLNEIVAAHDGKIWKAATPR